MGKKYIIELEDKPVCVFDEDTHTFFPRLHRVKGFNSLVFDQNGLDKLIPYTEPEPHAEVTADAYQRGYEAGLNDAWEAARKIWEYDTTTLRKIFGDGIMRMDWFMRFTASEAIEKIRQYEQEKEEQIQVGDEVIPRETEYDTMIVTRLWKDDYDSDCIDAIGFDGRISSFLVSRVSKTGKHYEIAAVLEKMRGE